MFGAQMCELYHSNSDVYLIVSKIVVCVSTDFPLIVTRLGYKVHLQSEHQACLVTSEVRHGYVVQIMVIRKEKVDFTNYLS